MTWALIGIGFTGAFTAWWLFRVGRRKLGWLPSFEVFFSPKGGCEDAIVKEIKKARREVLVQAYSFTAEPISLALVEAKKRGAHVEIVLDHSNEQEKYSDLHIFMEHGLAPLIDANHPIAHNKIMIIDRRTIVTGSFNFTNQAEKENAENLLIIKHHPDLVNLYRANFQAHKAHAKPAQIKAPAAAGAPAGHAAGQRRAA